MAMPAEGETFPTGLLRLTCTQDKIHDVCRLLQHLNTYNEVLWDVGLQLREDPCDELGYLSVVR
ncbi:hypothetical protein HPB52_001180 [Rhipicephalus sanguineus]|uniref:Uncharacterized protein n=1 Tax=Rhipicephalus sanguineus TaxID=34632 RepID=A0A9D4QJE9_RHISA|nr:hypothetical protein HPB52_001180 [Rhipicephalus sanguineus]